MNNGTAPIMDIHTAAFLEMKGVPVTLTLQGTRVIFEVPATTETFAIVAEFNHDASVPVATYARALRNLRGRMLARRDGENDGKQIKR